MSDDSPTVDPHKSFQPSSVIQINADGEEWRPEEPYRPCVPSIAWQLITQPAVTLTRIVVREQMCSSRVPKRVDNAVSHFEFFAHITLMSRFSRMGLGKPCLVAFSMARPTHSVVVT
jgi:hypothetical protein